MILVTTLAIGLNLGHSVSYAWEIVYDPTNHTENLANKLQLIKSYEEQLKQVQIQIAQLAKLEPGSLSNELGELSDLVNSLQQIRESTNAVGTDFRDMMEQFDQLRPDYQNWNGVSAKDYAIQNDKFRKALETSIEQALKVQGLSSPAENKKIADSLADILNNSQNAEGIVGVTQAANQIAALQARQLMKMEAILADSMRTQNLYYQKKIDAEKTAKKRNEDFLSDRANYEYAKADNDLEFGHYTR